MSTNGHHSPSRHPRLAKSSAGIARMRQLSSLMGTDIRPTAVSSKKQVSRFRQVVEMPKDVRMAYHVRLTTEPSRSPILYCFSGQCRHASAREGLQLSASAFERRILLAENRSQRSFQSRTYLFPRRQSVMGRREGTSRKTAGADSYTTRANATRSSREGGIGECKEG